MEPQAVVRDFYQAYRTGAWDRVPVAEDVVHVSPMGEVRGRAEFLRRCTGPDFLADIRVVREIAAGDTVCVEILIDGPSPFRACEWHVVRDDRITSIHAYFDRGGA